MSEEEALRVVNAWLLGADRLVKKLDDEGFHVLAHIVSDAASVVQHETLDILMKDQPIRNMT